MDSSTGQRYSVLLSKKEDLIPALIAKTIARFRGIPPYDALRLAKNSWGIVAEDLDEAKALKLIEELKSEGLGGVAIQASSIAKLPEAEPIAKLEPAEGSWQAFPKAKESFKIIPAQIALIAAIVFEEVATKITEVKKVPGIGKRMAQIGLMMTTGIPIPLGRAQTTKKIEQKSNLFLYADILLENPIRRLRIDAQDFNYTFLKERMSYNTLSNFKSLLIDLVKAAPQACRNLGTNFILEAKPIHTIGYNSLMDGERECRWLLTIRSIKNLK